MAIDKDVRINVKTDAAEAAKDVDRLSHSFRDSSKTVSKFGKIVDGAFERIGHHITDSLARAPGVIADMAKSMAGATHEAELLARQVGVSMESSQAMLQGFRRLRVPTDRAADAIKTLQENLGELQRIGTGPAKDSLGSLGLTLDDFIGKDMEGRLGIFAEALKNVEDPSKQLSIALEVMGDAGGDLLPALQKGAGGVKELTDAARASGAVLDDTAIAKARELDRTVADMEQQLEGARNEILLKLLPAAKDAAKRMGEWIDENDEFIKQDLPAFAEDIAGAFGNVATSIAHVTAEWKAWDKAITDFSNKELDNDPIIAALFGDRTVLTASRKAGSDPSLFQSTADPSEIAAGVALQEINSANGAMVQAAEQLAAKTVGDAKKAEQVTRRTLFELNEIASQHQGGRRKSGPTKADFARQQFEATKRLQDLEIEEAEAFGAKKAELLDKQLAVDLQYNKSLQAVATDRLELQRLQDEEDLLIEQYRSDRRVAEFEEKKRLMDLWLEAKTAHEEQIKEQEAAALRAQEEAAKKRQKMLEEQRKAEAAAMAARQKLFQDWVNTSQQLNSTVAQGAMLAGEVFIKNEERRAKFTNRARGAEAAGIAAMEAVRAASAYATGNIPGGVAHTAAAALATAKSIALISGALDPQSASSGGAVGGGSLGAGVGGGLGGGGGRQSDVEPGDTPLSPAEASDRPQSANDNDQPGPPVQVFVMGSVDDETAIKIGKGIDRVRQRHGEGITRA